VPNPVRDAIQVQVTSIAENPIHIDITDQSGKLIHSSKAIVRNGYNVIMVTGLSNNPPGIYIARVTVGSDLFRQKILIVK
jgi:Secretion system C-terminal sorting domain